MEGKDYQKNRFHTIPHILKALSNWVAYAGPRMTPWSGRASGTPPGCSKFGGTRGWVAGAASPARSAETAGPNAAQGGANRAVVFVAKVPLIGLEAVEALPPLLSSVAALHELVVVCTAEGETWAFDFLPQNATAPATLAALLAGGAVPGQVRCRQLSRVPPRSRPVGPAVHEDALAVAHQFQREWDGELQLFRRDCRTHVQLLAHKLTSG